MSGGRLVVLDPAGRDVKRYSLPSGLVTIGKDPSCDIRVMLPTVSAHHATVVVRANQTVIRSVSEKDTLVNGQPVSVVALQHGDTITLGNRSLRWEYQQPPAKMSQQAPAFVAKKGGARSSRGRKSAGEVSMKRVDKDVEMMLEMRHRASMPPQVSGSSGAKQVAIVQPQRRDTNEQDSKGASASKRQRTSVVQRQDSPKLSMNKFDLQSHTKASVWIENRKSSPRKSTPQTPVLTQSPPRRPLTSHKKATPLRTALLRKTVTPSHRVAKIHAPTTIDYTKQAALMLMARHTPKTTIPSTKSTPKRGPSLVVKKLSPISPKSGKKTPTSGKKSPKSGKSTPQSGKDTPQSGKNTPVARQSLSFSMKTPRNEPVNVSSRTSRRNTGADKSVSIFEISDSRSSKSISRINTPLVSPRKSSLKNPKSARKTESIKFDFSNLETIQDQSNDVFIVSDMRSASKSKNTSSQFSDTLTTVTPSPRRSINSRSRGIDSILETSIDSIQSGYETSTLTPQSNKSRGSITVQKALSNKQSPKTSPRRKAETYSIVDLVSNSQSTLYDSVSDTTFGTPQSRKTRSTINALGSSTPYISEKSKRNSSVNKSASESFVSEKSTNSKRSRSAPNSRSSRRSGYSDVIEISGAGDALTKRSPRSKSLDSTARSQKSPISSPKSSSKSPTSSPRTNLSNRRLKATPRKLTVNISGGRNSRRSNSSPKSTNSRKSRYSTPQSNQDGQVTPENPISTQEIGTPVLNIQSLLDSSLNKSVGKRQSKRNSGNKTFSGRVSKAKSNRKASKSLSAIKTVITRRSKDSSGASDRTDENALKPTNEDTITPKSSVKLVQEAVKEKHSTAKKPVSKRSIIDNLNDSDIVKELFSSPVKRNLSRSMTEFTKTLNKEKALTRKGRKTIALGCTPDHSLLSNTDAVPTDVFVSPLTTPSSSPAKRMHASNTPKSPQAVKHLIRSPRTRKSVKNDLTNISGVKDIFARSPNNDLRRVSGVKSLFQSEKKTRQPKNSLSNVSGVKKLYKKNSPRNDLRNVSGVKKVLAKSPRNDLRDVRGVKKLFAKNKSGGLSDLSGVEELFDDSKSDKALDESTAFDRLIGKPSIKATYSKSFNKSGEKSKRGGLSSHSLSTSYSEIASNVEKWVEDQLKLRLSHEASANKSVIKSANRSLNKSINVSSKSINQSANKSANKSANISKALQMLFTDTVEGTAPLQTSRIRNTLSKSADIGQRKSAADSYQSHTLPLKKRSLERSGNDRSLLPIKKRAIVSSTPVKGKVIMQAVDLGRVSPIIDYVEPIIGSPTRSPRPSKRSLSQKSPSILPISPKRTPASPKLLPASPKTGPSPPKSARRSLISPKSVSRSSIITPASKTTLKQKSTPKVTPKAKTVSPKSSRKSKTPTLVVAPKTVTRKSKPSPKTSPKVASTKKSVSKSRKSTPKSVSPRKSLSKTPKVVIKTPKSSKKSTPKALSSRKSQKATTPKSTPKSASKSISSKKAPKTVSPKKATPRVVSPKKLTPKPVSAKNTPRSVTPIKATPKQVTPRAISPKKMTPKSSVVSSSAKIVMPRSQSSTPKPSTPRKLLATIASSKTVTPRKATPKSSPKKSISTFLSPRKSIAESPKAVTPRKSVAKTAQSNQSPKPSKAPRKTRKAQPKVISPQKVSPKQTRRKQAPKIVVSPKKVVLSPKPRTTRGKAPATKTVLPKTKPVSPKKVSPKKKVGTKATSKAQLVSPKPKRGGKQAKKTESPNKGTPKTATPVKKNTRRRNPKANTPLPNSKKKGATLVVTKRSPISSPSPKPTRRGRNQKSPKKVATAISSPVKPRGAKKVSPKKAVAPKSSPVKPKRGAKKDSPKKAVSPKPSPVKPKKGAKTQHVVTTPKKTRAKAKKATVVVAKPSPQIKPAPQSSPIKATRGRNPKAVKTPSPPKRKQASKTVSFAKVLKSDIGTPKKAQKPPKQAQKPPKPKSPSPVKRGRKIVVKSPDKKVASPKVGRKRKLAEIDEPAPTNKKVKVIAKKASPVKPSPKGRQAKTNGTNGKAQREKGVEKVQSPKKAVKEPPEKAAKEAPKGRKAQQQPANKEAPKGRKRKSEQSPAAIKKIEAAAKRSRVATKAVTSPNKTKKKDSTAQATATTRSRRR